jgi:hypothetical protein
MNGEAVAQIVKPGSAARRARSKAGNAQEPGEGAAESGGMKPGARGRDEEGGRRRLRAEVVAPFCVDVERLQGARVQRHLAALAELAVDDAQQSTAAVDVVAVEADRLADAQPADREQPDQRLVGRRLQRRGEPAGRRHQRGDVAVGVQVRGHPPAAVGQQPCRRHLGGPIERPKVAGEAAHHRQLLAPPHRVGVLGLPGPRQGELGGHGRGTRLLEV